MGSSSPQEMSCYKNVICQQINLMKYVYKANKEKVLHSQMPPSIMGGISRAVESLEVWEQPGALCILEYVKRKKHQDVCWMPVSETEVLNNEMS